MSTTEQLMSLAGLAKQFDVTLQWLGDQADAGLLETIGSDRKAFPSDVQKLWARNMTMVRGRDEPDTLVLSSATGNDQLKSLDELAKKFNVKADWLRQCADDGLLTLFSGRAFESETEKLISDVTRVARQVAGDQEQAEADRNGWTPLERNQAREARLKQAALTMSRTMNRTASDLNAAPAYDGGPNDPLILSLSRRHGK